MRSLLRPTKLVTTVSAFLSPSPSFRTITSAFRPALLSPFVVAEDRCPTSLSATPENKLNNYNSQRGNSQQRFMAMSSNDEQAKAQDAGPEEVTLFDKIVAGDIPCKEIYSDDKCLAFYDVNPQAPVHFLVIPKKRDGLSQLSKARPDQKELLGHLMYVAQEIGAKECPGGFRITINDGKDGAQSVYHLHLHVMGGRPMKWPPG